MERTFETEVLSRLAVIESKLDNQKEVEDISHRAYNNSKQNEADIAELKDKYTWISRTVAASIITGCVGLIFVFIKIGIGVS